jgi:hypothetical protein
MTGNLVCVCVALRRVAFALANLNGLVAATLTVPEGQPAPTSIGPVLRRIVAGPRWRQWWGNDRLRAPKRVDHRVLRSCGQHAPRRAGAPRELSTTKPRGQPCLGSRRALMLVQVAEHRRTT